MINLKRKYCIYGFLFVGALTKLFGTLGLNIQNEGNIWDEHIVLNPEPSSYFYWVADGVRQWLTIPREMAPQSFQRDDKLYHIFSTGRSQLWMFTNNLEGNDLSTRTVPHFASPIGNTPDSSKALGKAGVFEAELYPDSGFPLYSSTYNTKRGILDFGLLQPSGDGYVLLSANGKNAALVHDWEITNPLNMSNGWNTQPSGADLATWDPLQWSYTVTLNGNAFWKQRYNGAVSVVPIGDKPFFITLNHAEHSNAVEFAQKNSPGQVQLLNIGWAQSAYDNMKWYYGPSAHYKYPSFLSVYGYNGEVQYPGWDFVYDWVSEIDVFDGSTFGFGTTAPPYRDTAHDRIGGNGIPYFAWWSDLIAGTSWNDYIRSVTLNVVNLGTNGLPANTLDFGPVFWPEQAPLTVIDFEAKRYRKNNHGVGSPHAAVVDDNWLYVYYSDDSYFKNTLKLARTNISGLQNYTGSVVPGGDPGRQLWGGSFEVYSDKPGYPDFYGAPVPSGFYGWLATMGAKDQATAFTEYVYYLTQPAEEGGKEIILEVEEGTPYTDRWTIRHNWYEEDIGDHVAGEYAWVFSSWDGTIKKNRFGEEVSSLSIAVAKIKNTDYWIAMRSHTIVETDVWYYDAGTSSYEQITKTKYYYLENENGDYITDASGNPILDYSEVVSEMESEIVSLHISDDLIHWSEGQVINNTGTGNFGPAFKDWKARFLSKDGISNTEIDADEFYIIGGDGGDQVMSRIKLSITINEP